MIKRLTKIFGTTVVNQLVIQPISLIITYPDIEVSIRCITSNYLVTLVIADTLLCRIVKLVTWVTVTHWYCHYTGLSLERRREGERERVREEEGGERRKERGEGKRREGAKWRNEGGKEEWRMEKEEEENEMDTLVPCVCVVINVHYVLDHPAPFSHLTSLWSSENSAVMSVVSLMNITSCSPSSCFREGTS